MGTSRPSKRTGTLTKRITMRTRKRPPKEANGAGADKRAAIVKKAVQGLLAGGMALVLLTVAMVLPWRWFAPPTSAFMLRERLLKDQPVDYRWAPWDRLEPRLAIAVVAAEDQKFPFHHGFDFASIAQALEEKSGSRRGASTISQQVAKNLFLWPGRSYVRKGIEAYLTLLIEALWPKRRILEIYLNVAEFGPGIFGAEAASRKFFSKPASRLSLEEAALLATVLPSPKRMSLRRPSAYMRTRAREIRTWVHQLGGTHYLEGL